MSSNTIVKIMVRLIRNSFSLCGKEMCFMVLRLFLLVPVIGNIFCMLPKKKSNHIHIYHSNGSMNVNRPFHILLEFSIPNWLLNLKKKKRLGRLLNKLILKFKITTENVYSLYLYKTHFLTIIKCYNYLTSYSGFLQDVILIW